MIVTMLDLKEKYREYADINGKIKRDVEKGLLFKVVRGIYETDNNTSGYLLSSYIYNPSYLSFEFALSFHNLIPEKVVNYTNATYNKNRSKTYNTSFGTFLYRDVPKIAFPYFVKAYEYEKYSYLIASPEKAICDMLYILPSVKSMKALKILLFENLRINVDVFETLNFQNILFLSKKYNSENIKYFKKIIEREYLNDNIPAND